MLGAQTVSSPSRDSRDVRRGGYRRTGAETSVESVLEKKTKREGVAICLEPAGRKFYLYDGKKKTEVLVISVPPLRRIVVRGRL